MNTTNRPAAVSRNYVNEWRTVGNVFVHKFSILSTDCVVFAAYERLAGHSSMMTHPELREWVGQLGSRRLPSDIDALRGQPRYDACDAFRAANDIESFDAIVMAFPEAQFGVRRDGMGEIETWAQS